jgi:hypothetical protein
MSIHARGTDPHEPLEAVLRAATAPGHPEELAGEEKAAAAFRAAVPAPRRRSLFARILTVKVVIVGAVAASTGVVLAAAGGVLPLLPDPTPVETTVPVDKTKPASVEPEPLDDREVVTTPPTTTEERPNHDKTGESGPGPGDGPGSGKLDRDRDRDRDDRRGENAPASPPKSGGPEEEETETSGPPSSRPETPDSPAQGAVTAVPPNGAVPPSPGD